MKTAILVMIGLATGLSAIFLAVPTAAAEKDIFGWAEEVLVGSSKLELEAKLDTGADTSSLHATGIRSYRRAGEFWVEFLVADEDSGRRVRFRKPLVRVARIKEHDGEPQQRPVVEVEICLGDHLLEVETSLTDRSEFLYPVLLGRNALEGLAVVDPGLTQTRAPECDEGGGTD